MKNFSSQERGQSLVLVALLMLVFMGLLAIALDGGNGYFQRRRAQNAADAGALAGARVLCVTGSQADASTTARDYTVVRNGAANADISFPADGIIRVTAHMPFQTFFARVLRGEWANLTATAVAEAGCFVPGEGVGILPIAWSCRYNQFIPAGEECELLYEDVDSKNKVDDDQCTVGNDPMYIIADTTKIEEEILCFSPPNSGTPAGAVDCDTNDDGTNDLKVMSGGNRSWLDLSAGGGGAADLQAWIRDGFPGEISIHTWFAGQTGAVVSVYDEVHDSQRNNVVIVPIFDQICKGADPRTSCPGLVHGEDQVVLSPGGNDYFHVISFALFHVTCIDAGSHKNCPGNDAAGFKNDVSTIEGCFVQGYVPGLEGRPSNGADAGAYSIYLRR